MNCKHCQGLIIEAGKNYCYGGKVCQCSYTITNAPAGGLSTWVTTSTSSTQINPYFGTGRATSGFLRVIKPKTLLERLQAAWNAFNES